MPIVRLYPTGEPLPQPLANGAAAAEEDNQHIAGRRKL